MCEPSSKAMLMVLMASWCVTVRATSVIFEDEIAGGHIDFIADKGIKLALSWRARFQPRMDAMDTILDTLEETLDTHYTSEAMPNVTEYAETLLSEISSSLDNSSAFFDSLNTNFTGPLEEQPVYFKQVDYTVNVGDHHDGSSFIVPEDGVYLISIKNPYTYTNSMSVMKNGADTIATISTNYYYANQLRHALRILEEGDEITTTGDEPDFFSVVLLKPQIMMPSTL